MKKLESLFRMQKHLHLLI